MIGHSEVEYSHPVLLDDHGKLPYDVQLRAPEERRHHWQSFVGVVAESVGSGSSSASKPSRAQFSRSGDSRSSIGDEGSHRLLDYMGETEELEEVQSPLKLQSAHILGARGQAGAGVN